MWGTLARLTAMGVSVPSTQNVDFLRTNNDPDVKIRVDLRKFVSALKLARFRGGWF
jgi:hypothetical protein